MKFKIESFLKGHFYPTLVFIVGFVIWSMRYFIPAEMMYEISFLSLFILTIPFLVIIVSFKNTIYTLPIIFTMLFSLGMTEMGIDTLYVAGIGFLNVFFILVGMIIHLFKYKVSFSLKTLGFSFIFISLYFMIPLTFMPFEPVGLLLSLLGPLYLFTYLFYANTLGKNEVPYLMRNFALIGLMLSFQLFANWLDGFSTYEGENFLVDFMTIFPPFIPGWGNVNDLTILMVLASSTVIYYLHKYPKSILPWLYLGWLAFWIYVSDSRGSIVTITLASLGYMTYAIFKRDKRQLINLLISGFIAVILMVVISPVVVDTWNSFLSTIDFDNPNDMLTGRITLWYDHEFSAWNEFLKYPFFGRGWLTENFILSSTEKRVTIYHSTFFQVLATGGIFGLLTLLYHWIVIGFLLKKKSQQKAVIAFSFTFILTQLHGLIDNTQYMLFYSIVTYITLALFENIEPVETYSDILKIDQTVHLEVQNETKI